MSLVLHQGFKPLVSGQEGELCRFPPPPAVRGLKCAVEINSQLVLEKLDSEHIRQV